ncbi:MAG: dihydropteroate synthase [Hyphomicrobiaceae bacterium]|nr:MAG: dihydropteroate synthase [Hyphomicrobiaceae bacterium]
MPRSVYIRPIGISARRALSAPEEVTGMMPLAGSALLEFAAFEVIERQGRSVSRRVASIGEVYEKDWGREALQIYEADAGFWLPRPRIAGLPIDRPLVMGIVNVTPDSFSDGGRHARPEAAIAHGVQLAAEGADILDIGGESTRPGSDPVPLKTELDRVLPVIAGLKERTRARISIDTRKAEVMRRAAQAGADIINDVSALTFDSESLAAAAGTGLPVVLMHALGDPKTMQVDPRYDDVLLDVFDYLQVRIAACEAAGIPRSRLIADPGIGFGKTVAHNLELLHGLSLFHGLGVPLMVGASRKRFIGGLTGVAKPDERVNGSIAAALAAVAQGAQLVRVHDCAATVAALKVWAAIGSCAVSP